MRLKDQVAIVTGAAQGMGYGTAAKLATEGAAAARIRASTFQTRTRSVMR